MGRSALSYLLVVLSLAGCSPGDPQELDRLMKSDPNFAQAVQTRDRIRGQIRSIKGELLQRKKALDAQIDKLRAEYDLYAKSQNEKIEKYQANIDANRHLLRHELQTLEARMEAKLTELKSLEKTMEEIRSVLKGNRTIRLTESERQRWEERRLLHSEKMRPLAEEIASLKTEIDLARKKSSHLN